MKYIAFLGPTGVGKTALLLRLRKKLGDVFEVVNMDSVQVYQGLNIGSAKPTENEQSQLKHHMIDLVAPHEHYDVRMYCNDVTECIKRICSAGKVPVLAGGTMLYLHTLVTGICQIPSISEQARLVVQGYMQYGNFEAWSLLSQWDPKVALRIAPNDTQRLMRALEVFVQTGKPLGQWQEQSPVQDFGLKGAHYILMPEDRQLLREKLAKRFKEMMALGLVDELRCLLNKSPVPLTEDHPSMRSIGYRHVFAHLHGVYDESKLIEEACTATCRYMKRQLTWLRHWKHPHQIYDCSELMMAALGEGILALHKELVQL